MGENDVMRSKYLDGFFPYYIQWKRIIADIPLSPRDYNDEQKDFVLAVGGGGVPGDGVCIPRRRVPGGADHRRRGTDTEHCADGRLVHKPAYTICVFPVTILYMVPPLPPEPYLIEN